MSSNAAVIQRSNAVIGVAITALVGMLLVPNSVRADPVQAGPGQAGSVASVADAPVVVAPQVGQTADSAAGRIGQRRGRDAGARTIDAAPMARIDTRIRNRVQNRLRNRIDRNYDPRDNAAAPFAVADAEATRPQ